MEGGGETSSVKTFGEIIKKSKHISENKRISKHTMQRLIKKLCRLKNNTPIRLLTEL